VAEVSIGQAKSPEPALGEQLDALQRLVVVERRAAAFAEPAEDDVVRALDVQPGADFMN
jgi:hypothetical protein